MTTYSLTAGSGTILLSTQWNQSGLITGSSIRYNDDCPVDPATTKKSLTGCTNTAAGQILYYWLENSDFELELQLTASDSYVSRYSTESTITINSTAATAQQNGYLDFASVNQALADFTVGDAADIAALCFACGVVQQAAYSSSATSTAWNKDLFRRSGMAGFTAINSNSNDYFYVSGTTISDAVFDILIGELLAGRPVGTSYPGHALVIDGYDQTSGQFHINYGWGGYQNGWYSKEKISEQGYYVFYVDIMPDYDGAPITVTNAADYGAGTLIRGMEQLSGIFQANTLTVNTSGIQISLKNRWYFDKAITINNLNADIDAASGIFYNTEKLTVNGLSGNLTGKNGTAMFYSAKELDVSGFTGNISAGGIVFWSNGDITVSGFSGTVSTSNNYAVYANGGMKISGLSGAVSASSYGLYAAEAMTVSGCSGTVRTKYSGIYASGALSLADSAGTVIAEAGQYTYAINGQSVSLQNFSGKCIAAGVSYSCAVTSAGGKLELSANGGRIFAGSYTTQANMDSLVQDLSVCGAAGIAKAIQHNAESVSAFSVSASNSDDTVLLKNYASLQGDIYLRDGSDSLSVLGGSYVYASAVSYVETVNLDSTSTIAVGTVFSSGANTLTVNMTITAETPSAEMIRYQGNFYNFYGALANKTLQIDLRAAADGEYVLMNAAGAQYATSYLPQLSARISTGKETITLACGKSSGPISLKSENGKLILVLDGFAASKAEALLFQGEKLLSVNSSVSSRTISSAGADSLRLADGGTASNITVSIGGDLAVSGDSTATGTTVKSNGFLTVNSNGRAVNTTVKDGGVVSLGSGATHAGALVIEENASVFADNSATIDFTISGSSAAAYKGISDLSRITGTPQYTLTVSPTQSTGKYILAENAADFSSTITVRNTDNTELGTLSVGQQLVCGKYTYTLNKNSSSVLSLEITQKTLSSITITAESLSKQYDGSALRAAGYTVTGNLLPGDTLKNVTVSGSRTNAGSSASTVSGYRIMRGTQDVTADYSVTCAKGTLSVSKRNVTLASASDSKEYDGTPLTNTTIIVSGDGFADGEGYTANVTGSQTAAGSSPNSFSYTLNSGTKAGNYNISTQYGTLEVISLPENLEGDSSGISWQGTAQSFVAEYSTDSFTHTLQIATEQTALDTYGMSGSYSWQVRNSGSENRTPGPGFTASHSAAPETLVSNQDGTGDIFFAAAAGTWNVRYAAQHLGTGGSWQGTGETVSLAGKNRITDIFAGSSDANILVMTDDTCGDALFLDDIYSAFPAEQQARLSQIREIRTGDGDDVADLTSQRFNYNGGITLRGGDGNDVLWANNGNNMLFGDAGNDRLVGASGNDVLAGGIGNDSMHGGGGDDTFCFCDNWGMDTVEQLSGGTVTLWFASENGSWDPETMTYTQGDNLVTVTGVTSVVLKYGDDGSARYAELAEAGAFMDASSFKIFEAENKGILAKL